MNPNKKEQVQSKFRTRFEKRDESAFKTVANAAAHLFDSFGSMFFMFIFSSTERFAGFLVSTSENIE